MTPSERDKPAKGDFLLAPNTILQDRYRIVERLARGGMGAVYEAFDLRMDTTVALKQSLTSVEAREPGRTVRPDVSHQFAREACLLAQLNHPALPHVSDYFIEGDQAFFVMQFIRGDDLSRIIAQQPGPFPRDQVIAWADQLLDALIYLHARDRQIIHRDIKPHNLKLTARGQIILLDFGLAKDHSKNSLSGSRSVFGYTRRYAPLEQIQDLSTTPRSDIYALGATLYHLLAGVRPPDALTRAAALVSAKPNPLKPAHEINSAVGPELAAILTRAMAQNPIDRYATAVEFRDALRRVGRGNSAPANRARRKGNSPTRSENFAGKSSAKDETTLANEAIAGSPDAPRRRFRLAIAAAFAILIAALAVFCLYYPWRAPPSAADVSRATTFTPGPTTDPTPAQKQHTLRSAPRNRTIRTPKSIPLHHSR
jgi:serine/threonine protein kinase